MRPQSFYLLNDDVNISCCYAGELNVAAYVESSVPRRMGLPALVNGVLAAEVGCHIPRKTIAFTSSLGRVAAGWFLIRGCAVISPSRSAIQ